MRSLGVVVAALFLAGSAWGAVAGGAISVALGPQSSPVKVLGATSSVNVLFDSVRIRNDSETAATAIGFRVLAYSATGSQHAVEPPPIRVDVKPNATVDLRVLLVEVAAAKAIRDTKMAGGSMVVLLEVAQIDFADGSQWTAVLEPRDLPAVMPGGRVCKDGRPATLVRSTDGTLGFRCDTTTSCIYCTNFGSSCTVTQCATSQTGCDPNCALQTCTYF